MRRTKLGIIISGLLLQSAVIAQPANTAASARSSVQVVPLYQTAQTALAVITIAGGLPTTMVFDTCAGAFTIAQAVAEHLKLKIVGEEESTDGATGKSEMLPLVEIPDMKVSDVSIGPVRAQKRPYEEADVIGIFSPSIFSGRLVTLELGPGRLRLSDPADQPDGQSYPFKDGLPSVRITVAGISMNAFLDSGNTAELTLPRRLMKRLSFIEPPREVGKATSVSGTQPVYRGKLRGDVRIGSLVLHNPMVGFLSDESQPNVGIPTLRKVTFAIAPKRQLTWVYDPKVDRLPLVSYAGRYGEFMVKAGDGSLVVRQGDAPPVTFSPLGSGLFENQKSGTRIQFHREGSRSTGLSRISVSGRVTSVQRNS